MYVAKVKRNGVKFTATIFEKSWSDTMYTHQITEINSKNFLFKTGARRWIKKEICNILFNKNELEIING